MASWVATRSATNASTCAGRSLTARAPRPQQPEVGDRLSQRLGASPEVLTERLQVALDAGQLKAGTSVRVVSDMFVGAIMAHLLMRAIPSPDEARQFVALILDGAGSRPARRSR